MRIAVLPLFVPLLLSTAAAQRLIQITSNTFTPASATISADGGTIAWIENNALWSANSDGQNPRLLVAAGCYGLPSLTEDGSRVCFLTGGNIALARTDGSGVSPFVPPRTPDHPMISADGSKIVFEMSDGQDPEIWAVNADGSGLTQLTVNNVIEASPAISGDGRLVAFATYSGGFQNIWTVRTDGTNLSQLTSFGGGTNVFPRLDRTGRRASLEASPTGPWDIYSSPVPGIGPTRLTVGGGTNRLSSISLDGERIAFHSDASGAREIWLVNFDGTGLRRLTSLGDPSATIYGLSYYPMTNGDGSMVAFVSRTSNGGANPEGDDEVFVFRDALTRTSPARVGQQCQFLCDVPADAGRPYLAAASLSTLPGIALPGGRTLFLNVDALLLLSLTTPSIFGNFAGVLDGSGRSPCWINVPPAPALAGLRFYAAFVTYAAPGGIRSVSNTIAITINP
jgi:TolB protein